MKRLVLLVPLTFAACRPHRSVPPSDGKGEMLLLRDDPLLERPVEKPIQRVWPSHGEPEVVLPSDFAESFRIFREGQDVFVEGRDYRRAAALFVRAAQALKVRRGPYALDAHQNRTILYQDAAVAWLRAGEAETGRKTLKRLRARGEAQPGDLHKALLTLDGKWPQPRRDQRK